MTVTDQQHQTLQARLAPLADLLLSCRPDPGDGVWVVGGAVRDALRDESTSDCDIITSGDAGQMARALARATGGSPFELSDEHGCWRVTGGDQSTGQIDICRLQGGTLETDIAARDFTVNAMAWNPDGGALVDLHNGAADLAAGTLRMVGPTAFTDDPLRVLRLARFSAQLDLVAGDETLTAARAAAPGITGVAGERIFLELSALLLSPRPRRGVRELAEVGLEPLLLPELTASRGMRQTRFHHLDVYEHTLAVLDNTADIVEHVAHYFPGYDAPPPTDEQRLLMRLAALCHDLGKPDTRVDHGGGRISFAGHDARGAEIASRLCTEWRTSRRLRQHLQLLVGTHLDLGFLVHRDVDRRVAWRYLQRVAPVQQEAVMLSVADRLATVGVANKRRWQRRHVAVARTVLAELARQRREGVPEPLLDGTQIAQIRGIPPGPELGPLVAALAEEQGVGAVTSRAEAEAFVRGVSAADS